MTEEQPGFDLNCAPKDRHEGKSSIGEGGTFIPLIKELTEAALEPELDFHLKQDLTAKRHNGISKKTKKLTSGSFELHTPREREGDFFGHQNGKEAPPY